MLIFEVIIFNRKFASKCTHALFVEFPHFCSIEIKVRVISYIIKYYVVDLFSIKLVFFSIFASNMVTNVDFYHLNHMLYLFILLADGVEILFSRERVCKQQITFTDW